MIIGLTGGIATGKSTVSAYLKELGIPVIDADVISREVVAKDSVGLQAVVSAFGKSILLENGELNRANLGAIIFHSKEKRETLNSIMHPLIRTRMNELQQNYSKQNYDIIVLDVPLLIENKSNYAVDEIWVVYVNEQEQITRLQLRNDLSREEAEVRVASQLSIEKKKKLADRVIDNSGTIEETFLQVHSIVEEIRKKHK